MSEAADSVFVVIPAHNEASVIAFTVEPLLAAGYSVVVVDDCSSDSTWQVLGKISVQRLRHPINLGQGAAIQTGTEYALRSGAGIIVHFDADGQHDPQQIPSLIEPILHGSADVVFGSRFLRGTDVAEVPLAKRLVLTAGRIVSGVLTSVWLSDAHNGFRALSRKAAASIRLRENGFAHATEILDEVRRAGLRYVEAPTTIRYTKYSKAKGQPISNALSIVVDLVLRKLFP